MSNENKYRLATELVLDILNNNSSTKEVATTLGLEYVQVARIREGLSHTDITGLEYTGADKSKLSDEVILEIFESKEYQKRLALRYNVSVSLINSIATGRTFGYLTGKKFVKAYKVKKKVVEKTVNGVINVQAVLEKKGSSIEELAKKHNTTKETISWIMTAAPYKEPVR